MTKIPKNIKSTRSTPPCLVIQAKTAEHPKVEGIKNVLLRQLFCKKGNKSACMIFKLMFKSIK